MRKVVPNTKTRQKHYKKRKLQVNIGHKKNAKLLNKILTNQI